MPNCKYIKQQEIVSYNGGVDWQDVMPAQYRKGQLIEHDSEDCTDMDTIYRWRKLTGVYLCVDDVKYEKLILDESYDGGLSWYPAYPSQYTTGEEIGVDEDYCNDKFVGHYDLEITAEGHGCGEGYWWDGRRCRSGSPGGGRGWRDPIKVIKCDGNPALTSADTKYYDSYLPNYKFTLISAEIGKCVTSIAASAFTNSSAMTYVSMADSVTTIGAYAFRGCTSLSGMNTTTPGVLNITSGVTSIGTYAFASCTSLTSIICNITTPPSLGTNAFVNTNNCPIYVPCGSYGAYRDSWYSVASRLEPLGGEVCTPIKIRYDYNGESYTYYCGGNTVIDNTYTDGIGVARSAITAVSIGDCVTEIGYDAFNGCTSLTSIGIPSGVTTIGSNAFSGCTGLTSIDIPSSVVSISGYAFYGCTSLTGDLVIPDSVTGIGNAAFSGCTSLSSCTIGSGVTTIGSYSFKDCTSLTGNLEIPDSTTTIGTSAFTNSGGFTSISIGSGITSIGGYVFYRMNHSSLTGITIYATTPPTLTSDYSLYGTNNCPIYVPAASVNAYKTANRWSRYSSRIRAIT